MSKKVRLTPQICAPEMPFPAPERYTSPDNADAPMMASQSDFAALFLTAGPHMQCGVGQFTLRLNETIETLDPRSTATLPLTRTEGSLADIWYAVGSAQNLVCNFPVV